jgi:hypothetical protein
MTPPLYNDNRSTAGDPGGDMAAIRDESARGETAGRRVRPVPAVTRAVAILRLLGRSEEALGVHAIARALTLIPSTCLHILRVLVPKAVA